MKFKYNNSSSGVTKDGIFVKKYKIKKVTDQTLDYQTGNRFMKELQVEIVVESVDKGFEKKTWTGGAWKRDFQTHKIIDAGGNFKFIDLLKAAGISEDKQEWNNVEITSKDKLNNIKKVPGVVPNEAMLKALIGKTVIGVEYQTGLQDNGKPQYKLWDHFTSPVTDTAERWKTFFLQKVDEGYVPKYKFEDSNSNPAPQVSNVAAAVESSSMTSI